MNTFATHLPVLKALSKCIPMRRVLEIGAGEHSTPFFLSLPDMEWLVSVESDPAWRERVKTKDPRHRVVKEIPKRLNFDLVFVDDGQAPEQRVATLRAVLSQKHPVVAVHDAEVNAYARVIRGLASTTTFVCIHTPNTAVIWPNGQSKGRELLRGMEEA